MADVTINYKGSKIAELSASGTKTLKTSGTYCEGDVSVSYTKPATGETNCKIYNLTLAKASGFVLLTALDSDVLAHINDEDFKATFFCKETFEAVSYACCIMTATNRQQGLQGSYPVYGLNSRQASGTSCQAQQVYYKPNDTTTNISIGNGRFRLNGSNFYIRPTDGYVRAGVHTLILTW